MKLIFVLDNVRSAFNVGSAFRTADGVGAEIHLIGITPVPGQDKKLEKTSLSSLDYVQWKHFATDADWYDEVGQKKSADKNKHIILSLEESMDLNSISFFDLGKELELRINDLENVYLVFGHEIQGVSSFLQEKSDYVVTIPMYGKKNSLNVATCIGIVGYKIRELCHSNTMPQ